MVQASISKLDAARRQLDTAIDLWFRDGDGLSVFTLGFAALKVLMSVYPSASADGFDRAIDTLVGQSGWKSMSSTANFLKHADRDPGALLTAFHPDMSMTVIGLAVLLYGHLAPELSLKMKAFDSWVESSAADELGIEDIDTDPGRRETNRQIRNVLKQVPREQRMKFALKHYEFVLANFERINEEFLQAKAAEKSFEEFAAEKFGQLGKPAKPS